MDKYFFKTAELGKTTGNNAQEKCDQDGESRAGIFAGSEPLGGEEVTDP